MAPEPKEIAKGIQRERRRPSVCHDPGGSSQRMDHNAVENVAGLQTGPTLYSHLTALGERQDGYLRIIPDGAAKSLYIKWKFTKGQWRGYYLMSVVEVWDVEHGLLLLRQKIDSVDVGVKNPVKDTAYDN